MNTYLAKKKTYINFAIFIFLSFIINNNLKADNNIEARLIPNCGATQGGIATATPEGIIYYCAQRMASIEHKFPGAINYFLLHEYGHIFLQSGNEQKVDCWTANELALSKDPKSKRVLDAAIDFIKLFKLNDPKYGGTGEDRALLITNCYINGPNFYKNN